MKTTIQNLKPSSFDYLMTKLSDEEALYDFVFYNSNDNEHTPIIDLTEDEQLAILLSAQEIIDNQIVLIRRKNKHSAIYNEENRLT